jgi:hypothetical protein
LQRGKDLRHVRTWISTGGYLASRSSAALCQAALQAARHDMGGTSLLPQPDTYYADTRYVLPLIGNLIRDFPAEAMELADQALQRTDTPETVTT